jgi:uncharacterized protein (DUF302 family)
METLMRIPFANALKPLFAALAIVFLSLAPAGAVTRDGLVRVKSAYGMEETIDRIKQDVAAKKIMLFDVIDQAKLAKDAGIAIAPSTLILFGNPPLGTLFLQANPESGIDWPVRVLVHQDKRGQVWAVYTDFAWIAKRHGIKSRAKEFKMASEVAAAITGAVKAP